MAILTTRRQIKFAISNRNESVVAIVVVVAAAVVVVLFKVAR